MSNFLFMFNRNYGSISQGLRDTNKKQTTQNTAKQYYCVICWWRELLAPNVSEC